MQHNYDELAARFEQEAKRYSTSNARAVIGGARLEGSERAQESQQARSQPVPLVRTMPAPAPYPVDALGPILAPAAQAIADLVQVPAALAGNSVLAAAALAGTGSL